MVAVAADLRRLSIIIPVLNETGTLSATLQLLQPLRQRGHEVIVVDGGSRDNSVEQARTLADRVICSTRGRALQMQAGAAVAQGDVLWFLHADTLPPPQSDRLILEALEQDSVCWGRFDVRFAEPRPMLRLVASLMNIRSRLSGIATGDQGIFAKRGCFERAGGFPPIPLMEDIALSRTLKKHSSPACLQHYLHTSARRWLEHGIVRTIVLMWGLRLGYFIGISPQKLARYYTAHQS
jgi:rSAM/selenodomain-associated transferase 2